jgi:hypothetical protein
LGLWSVISKGLYKKQGMGELIKNRRLGNMESFWMYQIRDDKGLN